MNRSRFLTSASALVALGGCAGGGSTPAAPFNAPPPAPPLPAGAAVADLRFGFSPTPAPFPGYDPAADAKALILAGTPSPAASPVPGTLATGSYAPSERYVIKVPQAWNGKLIVAGTPAFRSEFANDAIWGDFALAKVLIRIRKDRPHGLWHVNRDASPGCFGRSRRVIAEIMSAGQGGDTARQLLQRIQPAACARVHNQQTARSLHSINAAAIPVKPYAGTNLGPVHDALPPTVNRYARASFAPGPSMATRLAAAAGSSRARASSTARWTAR